VTKYHELPGEVNNFTVTLIDHKLFSGSKLLKPVKKLLRWISLFWNSQWLLSHLSLLHKVQINQNILVFDMVPSCVFEAWFFWWRETLDLFQKGSKLC